MKTREEWAHHLLDSPMPPLPHMSPSATVSEYLALVRAHNVPPLANLVQKVRDEIAGLCILRITALRSVDDSSLSATDQAKCDALWDLAKEIRSLS